MEWEVGDSPDALVSSYVQFQADCARKQREQRAHELEFAPRSAADSGLSICSYNVHFWLGPSRPFVRNTGGILETIDKVDSDVLVLQEFGPAQGYEGEDVEFILNSLAGRGYIYHTWAESKQYEHTFVTVIVSRVAISDVLYLPLPGDREAVCASFDVGGGENPLLRICGVHLDVYDDTGNTRAHQLRHLLPLLEEQQRCHLLLGDFNAVKRADYNETEWNKIIRHDKLRGVQTSASEVALVEDAGWIDCWTQMQSKVTTWNGRRIDYIFRAADVVAVKHHWVFHSAESDHVPLVCRVVL